MTTERAETVRLDERFPRRRTIDDADRAFIERMDVFFLATADARGQPQCSYEGGAPGSATVPAERTLAFPNHERTRFRSFPTGSGPPGRATSCRPTTR